MNEGALAVRSNESDGHTDGACMLPNPTHLIP